METGDIDYSSESDIESPLKFDEDHTLDSPFREDVLPSGLSLKPLGPTERVFKYDNDEADHANEES